MDGYKAYQYYLACKLHFTTEKYNVFQTRGAVKGTREAFYARNDRYIFEKLARKFDTDRDIIQYYVANFAYGNTDVIYDNSEATAYLTQWNKRKQSMTKIFVDDLATMLSELENNKSKGACLFNFDGVEYPVALKLLIGNKITLETLRIIDDIYSFLDNWRKNPSVSVIWENEFRILHKLKGFVKYDKAKIQTVWAHFEQELNEL
jgi:hypothetical protein